MLLTDAVMDEGEIKRNREQWKVLCSGNRPRERFAASNMWQIDRCADDFPEGEPDPDIIVKGLYQMKTQEEMGPD